MTFWFIVYLYSADGEFQAKQVFEAQSRQQCEKFAVNYTHQLINTQTQAQFFCVSDDHYNGRNVDKDVPLD